MLESFPSWCMAQVSPIFLIFVCQILHSQYNQANSKKSRKKHHAFFRFLKIDIPPHPRRRSIHLPKALDQNKSDRGTCISSYFLALTDDRVRENPWRKLETAPSQQAAADRAAMRPSWHDSRIMPFLAGTAGVITLEVIHFGWMDEERSRSQERSC